MRTWTATTTVDAPPEAVLDVLTDPGACARWAPVDFEVSDLDGRAPGRRQPPARQRPARRRRGRLRRRGPRGRRRPAALRADGPVAIDVRYDLAPADGGSEVTRVRRRQARPRHPRPDPRRGDRPRCCAPARCNHALDRIGRECRRSSPSDPTPKEPPPPCSTPSPTTTADRPRRPRRHARVRRGRRRGPRAARRHARRPAGPVHRDHGPVGLRQVDAHAPARRARPPDRRHGAHRRRGRRRDERRAAHEAAPPPRRLRLPGVQPPPGPHRRGERDAAAVDRRHEGRPRRRSTRCSTRMGLDRPPHAPAVASSPAASSSASRSPASLITTPDRPARRRADRQPRLDARATRCSTLLREAVELDGQTIVMVTHDPHAADQADRVIHLADGRIVDEVVQPMITPCTPQEPGRAPAAHGPDHPGHRARGRARRRVR